MSVLTNLKVTINMYKKYYLPVIPWNKKPLSKEAISLVDTHWKDFFAAATFEGL